MIHRTDTGSVAVLRLEHGKVSALDIELLEDIGRALDDVERSQLAVVLTGTGSSFSAGVDLFRVADGGRAYIERFLPLLDGVLHRLFVFPRPVVAALNGHAIAGGAILACACDVRVMAAGRGRIGVPELRVGVPFPVVPLEILRFATGPRSTLLASGGATYLPEEALRHGLVDEVVPEAELLPRARALAEDLGSIRTEAFALSKRQLRMPAVERWQHLARALTPEILAVWCAPETRDAIRSYLDRTLGKRG